MGNYQEAIIALDLTLTAYPNVGEVSLLKVLSFHEYRSYYEAIDCFDNGHCIRSKEANYYADKAKTLIMLEYTEVVEYHAEVL